MAKICNEEQTDWDEKIDSVLMGYCASFQASTKHSPYFMLFQQHIRLPIENDCLTTCMEEEEEVQLDGVIETLIASREKVFSDVELSITKAQRKQKDLKTSIRKKSIQRHKLINRVHLFLNKKKYVFLLVPV